MDLSAAFFPSELRCQCNLREVNTTLSHSASISAQERLTLRQRQRAAAERLAISFPTLLTHRLVLREIKNSDAAAYLAIRRALSESDIMDIWGAMPMTTGVGGLEAAIDKIGKISADRVGLKGIRWGICLRDNEADKSCEPLPVPDCANGCVRTALCTNSSLIGTIGFWRVDASSYTAEIGYELHSDHWGKGIMSEALAAVVKFGFKTMQLHSIEANIDPRNLKSGLCKTYRAPQKR
jgi:ribosomal-protein-alanine N-acetyltransferase